MNNELARNPLTAKVSCLSRTVPEVPSSGVSPGQVGASLLAGVCCGSSTTMTGFVPRISPVYQSSS